MIATLIVFAVLLYGTGCVFAWVISITELRSSFARPNEEETAIFGALLRSGGTLWPIVALGAVRKAVREAYEGLER